MKKLFFIEILLICALGILLAFTIIFFKSVSLNYISLNNLENDFPNGVPTEIYNQISTNIKHWTILAIISLIGVFIIFITIILTAINYIPIFKPITDKYVTWATARKADKQAKTNGIPEAKKKQRIADLEKELNELKKDE